MSDGIEMILGEIKGDLKAMRQENGEKFSALFSKIDKINETGCAFGTINAARIKALEDTEGVRRMTTGPNIFGIAGGAGGLGTLLIATAWFIGRWKGWW